ncbi:GWxTD domain-containing protein [bacterium]|nr:GWxTD domain-containing protein [bacterium]
MSIACQARRRSGLGPRWARVLAAGALLGGTLAGIASADVPEAEQPPFRSEGDLDFFLDLAAFRVSDGTRTEQELYVAVTNDQLTFHEEDGVLTGDLLLEIDVRDVDGDDIANVETSLSPQAASEFDSEDRGIVQIIRERVRLEPGLYHLQVTLTDRGSQKVGLFNRMRNVKNRARATVWIDVPDLKSSSLAVSDLTLVRSVRQVEGEAPFGRGDIDFDPNASRFYGAALPILTYYLEVYGGEASLPGDMYLVQAQITDAVGFPQVERRSRVEAAAETFAIADELPLDDPATRASVAAGRHRLAVLVMNERTRETVRVERTFEVLWSVASWGQDPNSLLQEMELVMTDPEFDTLEKLSPGARENYLAQFWHELDPTPDTPENETYDEFRRRIRLADRNYEATLRRGVLTDRGRVLVLYGPPEDVNYEYSSSGFGPGAGTERVADPGERAGMVSRPSTTFLDSEEFQEGDVTGVATQRGGATIKSKSLEVWTYDGQGHPLRPDHHEVNLISHRGLKFIFADEMGNGEYQLVGSQGADIH